MRRRVLEFGDRSSNLVAREIAKQPNGPSGRTRGAQLADKCFNRVGRKRLLLTQGFRTPRCDVRVYIDQAGKKNRNRTAPDGGNPLQGFLADILVDICKGGY
jgi:hypothetical protein